MFATGFLPEPDEDDNKHWSYEDTLKPGMATLFTGPNVDLRPFSSPRQDQKASSSCVAHATVKALEIKRIIEHGPENHVDLSRLAVYYLARELMFPPKTGKDSGTYISHAFDAMRRFGIPPESDWPFDLDKVNSPPSWMAMRSAPGHKITSFFKIRSKGNARVDEVVRCLQAGNPVVYGTQVGDEWFNYQVGQVLKLPVGTSSGHATVLVGFVNGLFVGENSWGSSWGQEGFYLMDPSVIANETSKDFWVCSATWETPAK